MKSLILGGTRSGKSKLAETMAIASTRPVTYIATAQALDKEMETRIDAHKLRRPTQWRIVEEPIELANAVADNATSDQCIIIDCLTLWLTNLLCAKDEQIVAREAAKFIELLPEVPGVIIMVSNEVGMGVTPLGHQTRHFLDEIGKLHQALAAHCDRVILCVAGLTHTLKGEPV